MLLVDLGPQGNTSRVFLPKDEEEPKQEKTLYSAIIHFSPLADIILETSFDNRSERLKRTLGKLKEQYDYTIIDNPPSLGLFTINSFVASDRLIIPVSTGFFALTGLVQLQEIIDMVKQTQLNPRLVVLSVL